MYQLAINQSNNKLAGVSKPIVSPSSYAVIPPVPASERDAVSFKSSSNSMMPIGLRTALTTLEEQQKYAALIANLGREEKRTLEALLKNGILLDNNSNDRSSTLDNLYLILSTERAPGLDSKVILTEVLNAVANPFVINQRFGDIPKPYTQDIIKNAQPNPKTPDNKIDEKSIDVRSSSACVSASIEFNLAYKMPAEFARFAQGLTSPRMAVDKTISLKNLTDNILDSVYLLNNFEIPFEMGNFDTAKVKLAPDRNAYIRAQIQNRHKDSGERSLIDVLMQSTFMNIGSQQTYDSLTDLRGGKFSSDNKGLIEFEKTFTESVVEDKNKISVTYQNINEEGKLIGYTKEFSSIKKNILDSLAMGENVIIGYTEVDNDKKVKNGHEITIIGVKQDKHGKLIFICNDTDDDRPHPIAYHEDYILPKIHHAGLPQKVVEQFSQTTPNWVEGLKIYKEEKLKNQK